MANAARAESVGCFPAGSFSCPFGDGQNPCDPRVVRLGARGLAIFQGSTGDFRITRRLGPLDGGPAEYRGGDALQPAAPSTQREISALPERQAYLAQGRQQVSRGFQVCCIEALRELLEYRLQKRPCSVRSPPTGPKCRQIDRGAYLPRPCCLTAAPL